MYITKYNRLFQTRISQIFRPPLKKHSNIQVAGKSRATPVIVQSGLIIISHCFTVKFP